MTARQTVNARFDVTIRFTSGTLAGLTHTSTYRGWAPKVGTEVKRNHFTPDAYEVIAVTPAEPAIDA